MEAYTASNNRKSFCTPFMDDATLAPTPFIIKGKEKFVNLSFEVMPRAHDEEKSIFFRLQNNNPSISSVHTIMYLYSWQDKKMIFNGFCVPPGESGKVLRYDNEDRSFCLEDTNVIVRHDGGGMSKPPEELFKEMSQEADACTFSVMVTHAEAPPPSPPPLSVEVNGFDTVDSGMVTSRARMGKGGETNQRFRLINLEYKGAPISFFHFTCLLASKE